MVEHAANGRRIKEIDGIFEGHRHSVIKLSDCEGKIEFCGAACFENDTGSGTVKRSWGFIRRFFCGKAFIRGSFFGESFFGKIFQREHHLEQRSMAQMAFGGELGDQHFEGQVRCAYASVATGARARVA